MRRLEKVASQIQRELAQTINEIVPEDLGLVTVTDIHVQPDLKLATFFISCFDEKNSGRIVGILERSLGEIQRILGRKLSMRYTPKLSFKIDTRTENIAKVEELLNEINTKHDS